MGDNVVKVKKDRLPMKQVGRIALLIVLAVLIAGTVMGGFYNVGEQEQAVVTMFGQVQGVKSAGLYFKIPWLQQVHKVDTTTHGMPIGYTSNNERDVNNMSTVEKEALMITSDFNFVDLDFYLEYRVSDPVKFLYASNDPESILRNTAQAAIRQVAVAYTVDDVITTGKSKIQSEVHDKLVAALEQEDIGLQVVNISMQDAEPPTNVVYQAFKAVETAKQSADTAINNAKAYQSEQLPKAEAEADKIIQNAEAAKAARVADAEGQVERFNRMYEEYEKYPLITKKRLFYETMEDILPDLKVIIDDGNTEKIYPLDGFVTEKTETTESTAN